MATIPPSFARWPRTAGARLILKPPIRAITELFSPPADHDTDDEEPDPTIPCEMTRRKTNAQQKATALSTTNTASDKNLKTAPSGGLAAPMDPAVNVGKKPPASPTAKPPSTMPAKGTVTKPSTVHEMAPEKVSAIPDVAEKMAEKPAASGTATTATLSTPANIPTKSQAPDTSKQQPQAPQRSAPENPAASSTSTPSSPPTAAPTMQPPPPPPPRDPMADHCRSRVTVFRASPEAPGLHLVRDRYTSLQREAAKEWGKAIGNLLLISREFRTEALNQVAEICAPLALDEGQYVSYQKGILRHVEMTVADRCLDPDWCHKAEEDDDDDESIPPADQADLDEPAKDDTSKANTRTKINVRPVLERMAKENPEVFEYLRNLSHDERKKFFADVLNDEESHDRSKKASDNASQLMDEGREATEEQVPSEDNVNNVATIAANLIDDLHEEDSKAKKEDEENLELLLKNAAESNPKHCGISETLPVRETAEQMKPMDKFQEEGRLKSASKDPAVDELTKDNASSTEKERFTTQAREMDFERIKAIVKDTFTFDSANQLYDNLSASQKTILNQYYELHKKAMGLLEALRNTDKDLNAAESSPTNEILDADGDDPDAMGSGDLWYMENFFQQNNCTADEKMRLKEWLRNSKNTQVGRNGARHKADNQDTCHGGKEGKVVRKSRSSVINKVLDIKSAMLLELLLTQTKYRTQYRLAHSEEFVGDQKLQESKQALETYEIIITLFFNENGCTAHQQIYILKVVDEFFKMDCEVKDCIYRKGNIFGLVAERHRDMPKPLPPGLRSLFSRPPSSLETRIIRHLAQIADLRAGLVRYILEGGLVDPKYFKDAAEMQKYEEVASRCITSRVIGCHDKELLECLAEMRKEQEGGSTSCSASAMSEPEEELPKVRNSVNNKGHARKGKKGAEMAEESECTRPRDSQRGGWNSPVHWAWDEAIRALLEVDRSVSGI